jgi:multimeric flavodoxin WrbA
MVQKKVLILMGSPRKAGNSAVLAEHLAKGAMDAGARVQTIHLHGMNINPCTGCDECQGEKATGCVIDDAMQDIYRKLEGADSIVFASPIYWFSVTAQLKMVIDRIYAIGGGGKNILAGKNLGILLGTVITGSVYGSAFEAGEIASNTEVLDQARELGEKLGGKV